MGGFFDWLKNYEICCLLRGVSKQLVLFFVPSQPGLHFVNARVRRLLLSLETVWTVVFISLEQKEKARSQSSSVFASVCLIAYITHLLTWLSVITSVCLSGCCHSTDLVVCKPWCLASCFYNGCMYNILGTFVFLFQIPNLHPAISTFLCFVWRKEKIWLILPAAPGAVAVDPFCNSDKELRTKEQVRTATVFCIVWRWSLVDRAYSPDFKTIIVMGT